MKKRVSINIYKKGDMRIDYMVFEVNPMRRLSVERIIVSDIDKFKDKFSSLLENFKQDGVDSKQFGWSAPLERNDRISIESKDVARAAKEIVIEKGYRESVDKLGRKKSFITGRGLIDTVKRYFVNHELIVKNDPSGISLKMQRILWEIGLNISNRKWSDNFEEKIKEFENIE